MHTCIHKSSILAMEITLVLTIEGKMSRLSTQYSLCIYMYKHSTCWLMEVAKGREVIFPN